jgi:cellulose synthase/poly-beta-1,6-N-acetylglucosamine synthase-like glycosyltransferase
LGVPRVAIIIPSRDGNRDGAVPRLLESIDRQTFRDHKVILVCGVSPQGRAINEGVAQSRSEILLVVDDDSRLASADVIGRLVDCLDLHPDVGMAGASIAVDPESTPFQRAAAAQFPRLHTPDVSVITDSDFACHGCCAIRRPVFEQVGREREDIVRGLDPDLRERIRAAGFRVVLVPGARIYHPLPDGWRALGHMFFRNGFGSAYSQKFQPESVYETHEQLSSGSFRPRRSFVYRALRFPARLLHALVTGKWIRLAAYCAYAAGYVYGLARAQPLAPGGSGNGAQCTPANDSRAA